MLISKDGSNEDAWNLELCSELGGRYSSAPTSLLVRNIARDSRPEDVRIPFERFGPVKDVYLPKDYYSGYVCFFKPILICIWKIILARNLPYSPTGRQLFPA